MIPLARKSRLRRALWASAAVLVLLTVFIYIRIRPALLAGKLSQAIENNNAAGANAALNAGADVNGLTTNDPLLNTMESIVGRRLPDEETRLTPLTLATVEGRDDMVRLLVAHGANVNRPGGEWFTPLMFAAAHCNAATVQLLIDKGANVNAKTGDDGTPLLYFGYKRPAIYALLVRAGARGRNGKLPETP